MATSRGHCSSDNIRASVILKLRSRHASVRPSVCPTEGKHDNSFPRDSLPMAASGSFRRLEISPRFYPPWFHRRQLPFRPFYPIPRSRILMYTTRREFYFSLFSLLAICIFRICIYPLVIWLTFCCLLTVASKINQVHAYSTSFQTAFPRKLRSSKGGILLFLSRFRIRNLLPYPDFAKF